MKPTILDICCGAGGAAKGYVDAGFDVIGVDIEHHDFPFGPFYMMDAIEALEHVAAEGTFVGGERADEETPRLSARRTRNTRWCVRRSP